MRYVREYATYQRLQGEELLKKQEQVNRKKQELRQVKSAKKELLKEREAEKAKLEEQEKEKKTLVASLQKKQRGLQNGINKKRREANQLNARIDRLIAEEIEKARKKAEEKNAGKPATAATKKPAAPLETYTMSKADRELSGSFVNNRGKLPIPITDAYIITSHYGQYAVEGLRNVKLDNKGIDIQGKPGAQARSIFNGKVAAVFKLNGLFNILIRHGNYISVYCNLSSASVKQGDDVTTKQTIGQIFSDSSDNGRTVLHFQLRKEKEKLNPESWLNR
jgi:murein hydrolase activator